MKKSVIILTLILWFYGCSTKRKMSLAEYQKLTNHGKGFIKIDNDYYDKFIGTWIWEKDGKRLLIEFQSQDISFANGDAKVTLKQLKGKCIYYENGKKVEMDKSRTDLFGITYNNPNQVIISIINLDMFANSTKIELNYISENELRFQYAKRVKEESKRKIPYPVDISLFRK